MEDDDETKTYRIIRFYKNNAIRRDVIKKGLTKEEAKEHCKDKESSSATATSSWAESVTKDLGDWFDGWEEE
jgi:hypothetical protein